MKKVKSGRRVRRAFTPEFKADAVKLVQGGRTASQVAKELDLTETALREWVKRADVAQIHRLGDLQKFVIFAQGVDIIAKARLHAHLLTATKFSRGRLI